MSVSKTTSLGASVLAFSMLLFPPWLLNSRYHPTGPAYAGGYAFVACPPNDHSTVATLDIERLTIQLMAIALLAGAIIIAGGLFMARQLPNTTPPRHAEGG